MGIQQHIATRLAAIVLLMFLACFGASGQWQAWTHIPTSDMANQVITCLAASDRGEIYVGTQDGLNVYDGRHFAPIILPDSPARLINPYVESLCFDNFQRLWIASRTHIFLYVPATNSCAVVCANDMTEEGAIRGIAIDSAGMQLFLLTTRCVKTFRISANKLTLQSTYRNPNINQIAVAENLLFMLIDNRTVALLNGTSATCAYAGDTISDIAYIPGTRQLALLELKKIVLADVAAPILKPKAEIKVTGGALMKARLTTVNNYGLALHFDGLTLIPDIRRPVPVKYDVNPENQYGLKTKYIYSVVSDAQQNIWIAEDNLDLAVLPFSHRDLQFIPLSHVGATQTWNAWNNKTGDFFFFSTEKGINTVHYRTGIVDKPIKPLSIANDFVVTGIIKWAETEVLITTESSGLWLLQIHNRTFRPFLPMPVGLRSKCMWGAKEIAAGKYLFHSADGLYLFDRQNNSWATVVKEKKQVRGDFTELTDNNFFCVYPTPDSEIWLGTGAGITVLNQQLKIIHNYGNLADGLGPKVVMDINAMDNSGIYVATLGGGVYRFANGHFDPLPLAGEPKNIYNIAAVNGGNLLFSTSKGLCMYTIGTGRSALINEHNGLPINDFNQQALFFDGHLLIGGGDNGVIWTPAERLASLFRDTLALRLLSHGKEIEALNIPPGQKNFNVVISIPGTHTAHYIVEYKMEGVDENWQQQNAGDACIRYHLLPPGSYSLLVNAIDPTGITYIHPARLAVVIAPFFWQTNLFRYCVALAALALIVIAVRFFSQITLKWKLKKVENEQRVAHERLRISRELHDNIGSQLTFLIIGLESSEMLLQKNDGLILATKLKTLQQAARESMQQLRDAIWTLNKDAVTTEVLMARIEAWLQKLMTEFPNVDPKIECRAYAQYVLDSLTSLHIFRIVQEATHNALKHSRSTRLTLRMTCRDSKMVIEIEDNGVGFDVDQPGGNGIRYMAARAAEMKAKLKIYSGDTGTRIQLEVSPIKLVDNKTEP